jgi:hypothetical protein
MQYYTWAYKRKVSRQDNMIRKISRQNNIRYFPKISFLSITVIPLVLVAKAKVMKIVHLTTLNITTKPSYGEVPEEAVKS